MKRIYKYIFAISFFITCFNLGVFAQQLPEMILVEGGTFKMGSTDGQHDEQPVHDVKLKTFHISKYEITVEQYQFFCKETGWKMPEPPEWGWHKSYPIVNISWKDAGAYTLWLSRKTGKRYRLPNEKEWEYAAKGGKNGRNTKYSGGDNPDEIMWYYETTYGSGAQPVGQLKANEIGIYDMSGNVWEWCKDQYTQDYRPENQNNSSGQNYRIVRGGSWDTEADYSRVTNRKKNVPESINNNTGFRVVMDK